MRTTITLAIGLACAGCGDDSEAEQVAEVVAELERVQSRVESLERELERRNEPAPADASAATGAGLGQTVQLELAKAQSGDIAETTAVVSLTKDAIYFGEERVTIDELEHRLEAALVADRDTSLIVSASPDVPHATVVDVLDRAKRVGIERFAIATKGVGPPPVEEEPLPEPEPFR